MGCCSFQALFCARAGTRTPTGTAPDRFIAVLAGEIVNHIDPKEAVAEIDRRAFGTKSPGAKRRMGLAMISELPVKRSGELASALSSGGNAETRVHALIALGKLRLPEISALQVLLPL